MGRDLSQLSVLVVDDSDMMRRTLEAILLSLGVGVVLHAQNAYEAFEVVCELKPDFVISDWDMAPGDGFVLVDMIRNEPDSPNRYLPVIMLTGHSDKERVEMARDHGVTEFLAKPVMPKDLLARVLAIIENPRSFVRSTDYFGPDRRRRASPDYGGMERRDTDDDPATGE